MPGEQPRHDQDAPEGFEVPEQLQVREALIRRDGSAAIDGAPVHVPDGETVHGAVLDVVHHQALDRGEPVEAVVHDEREGQVTRIEVAPDGSSRILRHDTEPGQPEPEPGAAAGSSPAEPVEVQPGPGLSPAHGPEPAEADPPVPAQLAELVAQINHALNTGAVERALVLAFRLREHTARTFGAEHPCTLEAHALRAFAVYRSGNHGTATAACLELARARHRLGDPRAHDELVRATAAWWLIDDPVSMADHGEALLAAWSLIVGTGGSSASDASLMRGVNQRLGARGAAAVTRAGGAA